MNVIWILFRLLWGYIIHKLKAICQTVFGFGSGQFAELLFIQYVLNLI